MRGFPVSPADLPGTRHNVGLRTAAAALRRSGDAVTSADAALRNAEAEQARARRAIEAAQAPQMDLGNALKRLHQLQQRRPRRRPLRCHGASGS